MRNGAPQPPLGNAPLLTPTPPLPDALPHQFSYSTKAVIETPPGETWQIAFAPLPAQTREGDVILAAAGGASNRVVIWSTNDAEKVAEFCLPEPMADGGGGASAGAAASADPAASAAAPRRSDRFVLSVAYSPDGARLACGSMDGGVHVFDTATGALVHSLAGHFKPVRALAFAPDSRTLVTGCDDMLVHLYDVGTGALVDALSGHESWVLSLAPHPGGAVLATGSADATVRLWDLRSRGAALQVAREASDQVWGVAWDAEGRRLAAVSDDKGVVVFAAG
jgi:WD repeat-containing protein 61